MIHQAEMSGHTLADSAAEKGLEKDVLAAATSLQLAMQRWQGLHGGQMEQEVELRQLSRSQTTDASFLPAVHSWRTVR